MENSTPRILGNKYLKVLVAKTLSVIPSDVKEHIAKNVTFIGPFDDAWAYTLQASDLETKYIVVISDELLAQNENQIIKTLIHEIGHATLGHRNAFYKPQSQHEIKKQEREANEFARRIIYV